MAAYRTLGEPGGVRFHAWAQYFPYPNFGRCVEYPYMTPPPRKKPGPRIEGSERKVTLKTIAEHLGLTPGTVSAALNNSPAARSIPAQTKNRIIEPAQTLNYRPNFFARTLRLKRTYTIGVIPEEIGDAYASIVISGMEGSCRKTNYCLRNVIPRDEPQLR